MIILFSQHHLLKRLLILHVPSFFVIYESEVSQLWSIDMTDKWIKNLWFLHIMNYYAGTRGKIVRQFVITCMELESIMLNKISQQQGSEQYYSSLGICLACGQSGLIPSTPDGSPSRKQGVILEYLQIRPPNQKQFKFKIIIIISQK